MNLDLEGKVALVTGGARGIGAAIVEALWNEGAVVGIVDVDAGLLKEAEERFNGARDNSVLAVHADLSQLDEIKHAVDRVAGHYSALDVLVNNAGIGSFWKLQETTLEKWQSLLNVNLTAPMLFCKYAEPYLERAVGGSIVNITSVGSEMSAPGGFAYSASKGGLQSLSRALAVELAEKGIRVNCVQPHAIQTPMWDKLGDPGEVNPKVLERIPVGHLGNAEDVAEVVAFLASGRTSFVTGATYAVNGGISAML